MSQFTKHGLVIWDSMAQTNWDSLKTINRRERKRDGMLLTFQQCVSTVIITEYVHSEFEKTLVEFGKC